MAVPSSIRHSFFAWVDEALNQPIPKNTVAYHFNLYEGTDSVHVQLVGTETFDAENEYWPGGETFSTGEHIFEVPFNVAGVVWEEWLESLKELISAYIANGSNSTQLRNSQGVGVGFVDGDMYILWPLEAA
jgi:hypothetical protein